MRRVFLLSPAHSGGKRAALLVRPQASFELARQVQSGVAAIGDVFAFCSGLYFRGKLAYARSFAQRPADILVITPTRGLLEVDALVGTGDLAEFARVSLNSKETQFTVPLRQTAEMLAARSADEFILLGSVATGKYLDTLLPVFGDRLLFPLAFSGLGDMSRGALLLRAVGSGQELIYGRVRDASRKKPIVHEAV